MNEITTAPLTHNEMIITGIERAKAIELSELMSSENMNRNTGDYFVNSEIGVKSIASHWSKFIKQDGINFTHPQQLEQAYSKFVEYLASKKPYSKNDYDYEPVRFYVADKLLEVAFNNGLLTSQRAKQDVSSVLFLRDISGVHAKIIGKMCKYFLGELKNGNVDLVTLSERSVIEAFSGTGVLLLDMLSTSAKLALEVKNGAA